MKFSPEQIVQRDCVNFTRVMCPGVLLIASMNGMYLGTMRNAYAYIVKMKILGMRTGDLDIRLHWREEIFSDAEKDYQPKTAYIELKAGKNKPTDEQLELMDDLDFLGIPNGWTNSLQGYVDLLKKFGVPIRPGLYAGVRL